MGLTTFRKLRPSCCVFANDSSALNVCVCTKCENAKLYISALQSLPPFHDQKELLNDLIKLMVCENPTKCCQLQECDKCDPYKMMSYVGEILDRNNINQITHKFWVSQPRCELTTREDVHVDSFLDCLSITLQALIPHLYVLKNQTQFFRELDNIPHLLSSLWDFAENYVCEIQNAPQGVHWGKNQIPLHINCTKYNNGNSTEQIFSVFVCEAMKHNTIVLYACQEILIKILKEKFANAKKIIYKSDGCAEQYKNKKNFKNLCLHKKDFDLEAQWHFSATSHGKGPCDGIGGSVKRRAREAAIRQEAHINSAKSFYDFFKQLKEKNPEHWSKYEFYFISEEIYKETEEKLKERFSFLRTVPGTQGFHAFKPNDENTIFASKISFDLDNETRYFRLSK